MGFESGKGREDIRTSIAECQKGCARQTLAHAKDACNCAKVDAKEIAGRYADGAEEETQPDGYDSKGDTSGMVQPAIIQLQVGEEAGFFIRTIQLYVGALVFRGMDEVALSSSVLA